MRAVSSRLCAPVLWQLTGIFRRIILAQYPYGFRVPVKGLRRPALVVGHQEVECLINAVTPVSNIVPVQTGGHGPVVCHKFRLSSY